MISFFLLGLLVLITGHWSVDTVVKDKSYNKKLEINMLVIKAITTISMIFIKVGTCKYKIYTNKSMYSIHFNVYIYPTLNFIIVKLCCILTVIELKVPTFYVSSMFVFKPYIRQ